MKIILSFLCPFCDTLFKSKETREEHQKDCKNKRKKLSNDERIVVYEENKENSFRSFDFIPRSLAHPLLFMQTLKQIQIVFINSSLTDFL
jgi:uncharacterized Zn finger protein (UPF0148 family)